jgi:hypothetical protein
MLIFKIIALVLLAIVFIVILLVNKLPRIEEVVDFLTAFTARQNKAIAEFKSVTQLIESKEKNVERALLSIFMLKESFSMEVYLHMFKKVDNMEEEDWTRVKELSKDLITVYSKLLKDLSFYRNELEVEKENLEKASNELDEVLTMNKRIKFSNIITYIFFSRETII